MDSDSDSSDVAAAAPAAPIADATAAAAEPAASSTVQPLKSPTCSSVATISCVICMDDVPAARAMALCEKGHQFCVECCWGMVRTAISDGLVPACALEKQEKCGAIPKLTADRILSAWVKEGKSIKEQKAKLDGWTIRGSAAAGWTSGKVDEVYRAAELARLGAVQCIGKKCTEFCIPPIPHSSTPQRLVCKREKCGTSFCAACRQPYHFRTSCEEALRINARWVAFLERGLKDFLVAAVKVDPDRYHPVLKELTRSKGAADAATNEALKRFDELRKMEVWKEKHCKRCPHCKRVIHKMSGCDAMVCGNDAHGGNEQRGCGKHFAWSTAPAYSADLRNAAGPQGEEGESAAVERRLQLDAREEHFVCIGSPMLCDGCGDAIIGPRMQCMQCVGAVELCISCVAKVRRCFLCSVACPTSNLDKSFDAPALPATGFTWQPRASRWLQTSQGPRVPPPASATPGRRRWSLKGD